MFVFLLLLLSSADAVTLTGSSEYAVPGSDFTLTCDVQEEANAVTFYRRPDGSTPVGGVQVGGSQCYNTNVNPVVPCTPDVCSCVTTSPGGRGTVFRWVIQPQTGYHGSLWFCKRTNLNLPDQILDSPDFTLNIADGPGTSIALSPPNTTYTRTEGNTLPDITCITECRPGCTFVWTKPDNTNLTASPLLSLGQLDRSEHGVYRCTAWNVIGTSNITTSVNVHYGPASVGLAPATQSYTIAEGQTVPTITCSVDCNPTCNYSWTKDGQSHTTGSDLRLTNIQRGQMGVYRCTVSNAYGSQTSSDVTVTVKYGPGATAALSPPDIAYTRNEGDTLPDITCTAYCRPDCTFVWTKPDNTKFTTSAVLSLGQLDRSENGTYRCTAGNEFGESFITTGVAVQYGPGTSIALSPPDTIYTRTEGDTLPDITCTADCRPGCTYVWTKPDNTNFTASAVMSLGQLYRSERGTYKCTARNDVGESTTTSSVTLLYGPSMPSLDPTNVFYTVEEDQSISAITCNADCNPLCTYTWTKDGQSHTAGSTLVLSAIQRNQEGIYRCTATNDYGDSTYINVNINVKYGPGTSIALSPPDTTYTMTEGDTLPDITCTADCRPDCTFVWIKPDNTNFSASAVLSLRKLERAENGKYICIAKNVFGESSKSTSITVMYGPGTSTSLSPSAISYTRTENDTLPDITCTADCRPGCTFVWTKPDNTNFTTSAVLSLGQLDRSEHGTYRCTAGNVVGESTSTTSVNVQYGPGTVTLSPPDTTYTRTEGGTLPDITCTAECRPDCTFVWTKPDNINLTASSVLSLGQLDKSEHGRYRCTARNVVGTSTTTATVIVQFPPEKIQSLTYTTGDGNVTENGPKSLICTVESFPPSTIQWYFKANNSVLLSTPNVLESTYTLTTAGCLDTGLYTCSARNSVSGRAVTMDIGINVLCKPRPGPGVKDYHKFGLATSENLTITAMFLANPEPSFTWTFQNSSPVAIGTELFDGEDNFAIQTMFFTSNLSAVSVGTRNDIREDWFGLYNVTATNSQGSERLSFIAEAKGKPSTPDKGSATCPYHDRAILSWISAFNGGSTQNFVVGKKGKTKKDFTIDKTVFTPDPGQRQIVNISVSGLSADTHYFFKVYAVNIFGNSTFEVNCTTKAMPVPESSPLGPILGGVGGSIAAIVVVIVVVVIVLRRKSGESKRGDDTEMITGEISPGDSSDGLKLNILYESSDGLKANILYETSDPQPGSSSEYAVIQKKSKDRSVSPDASYAVVDKSMKGKSEEANDVYAKVCKAKGKGGKGKHKQMKPKQKADDIYEKVEDNDGSSGNIYANCKDGVQPVKTGATRKQNQDGLIYLDIEFKDDKQNGRNYVIHGIENRTDYVDIDFTKHADPLPPDNENSHQPKYDDKNT